MRLRGLYAVTPDSGESAPLLERVRRALEHAEQGGWAALQYRNKLAGQAQREHEARALCALARDKGVAFIVNDDPALALEVGADGAHLGRDDGDLGAARRTLAGRLLGVSCYDRLELARRAVAAGADYVAFGSVFASPTKPNAVRAPLALFGAARGLGVPLVAIGGITLDNAAAAIAAGADCVAVISDLFDVPNPGARALEFARLFRDHEASYA